MGSGKSFTRYLRGIYSDAILRRPGWSIEATNGGHARAIHVSGAVVYFAASPSDHRRAEKNVVAMMKRVERRIHTV